MFKIIALIGAIAGGATYGLYAHTDLFNKHCDGGCPLSAQADPSPCCQNAQPKPDCCQTGSECCEPQSPCCAAPKANVASSCCASKTIPVSTTKAACCADPCPQCAVDCSVCCPACPSVCGSCCGLSTKAAIAGPAAIVAGALKK
jgi:hypothetical protein